MTTIRSSSNVVLKRVRAVLAGRDRDAIALEGERLVRDAIRAGVEPEVVLVADDRAALLAEFAALGLSVRPVTSELLQSLGGVHTTPRVVALAALPRTHDCGELAAGPGSRLAVAAGIADPGNLGGLARVAEAAGCEALAILSGGVRPWNDKALRGSMGSLLRLPVIEAASGAELSSELGARGYRQVMAQTRGGVPYDEFDWSGPLALWFPAETGVLPDGSALPECEAVTIPMFGAVESLNVTAAAAILLFAAARPGGRKT